MLLLLLGSIIATPYNQAVQINPKNSPIQTAAAQVLTATRKRVYISPVLAPVHWLTVKSRIEF